MKIYPNLFKGLGKIEPEHHIKLKEDISPKVHPPRKKPASLREKVKEEMNNMEKTGVIKKIDEPTEWVNSIRAQQIARMVTSVHATCTQKGFRMHKIMCT